MIDPQNPFEDRINLTTMQCVLRYKLSLEDKNARLEFDYTQDNHRVVVKVAGKAPILEARLHNGYSDPVMRSLDMVETLVWIKEGVPVEKSIIPTTHQAHMLTALYNFNLL